MTTAAAPETLLLGRARQLAALRFAVIPILWRTKKPRVKWKAYQSSLPTDADLARWFTPDVRALAVLCGRASAGLLCIDFDILEFYYRWLALVEHYASALPTQRTGKGIQVFCRCADAGRNTKLAAVPDPAQACGWRIAIETRGDGGYACVGPSLHPSGKRYVFIQHDLPHAPHVDMATVEFLLEQARALNEVENLQRKATRKTANEATQMIRHHRARLTNHDNSVITAWNERVPAASVLRQHGYTVVADEFTRPGKTFSAGTSGEIVRCDDGVVRSVHYSTNDPLNDERFGDTTACGIHDSFDLFTTLEMNGDAGAAVRLAAQVLGLSHRTHTDLEVIGACMEAPETGEEFQKLFLGEAGDLCADAAVERLSELVRVHTDYEKQVQRILGRSELRTGEGRT